MYKVITFDMFSAVLDIEGTAAPIIRQMVPQLHEEDALPFFRVWRTKQWDYVLLCGHLQKDFVSYTYLTSCALDYACEKYGLRLTCAQREKLMSIWFSFQPWPEAKKVIEQLKKKGYIVAMLSNGDTDMLKSIAAHCAIQFDHIFSAEMAGAYKPRKEIYYQVWDHLKIGREDHLHIAGSMFDVMGAVAAGVHCIWSNRYGDCLLDRKYVPDLIVSNLNQLPML